MTRFRVATYNVHKCRGLDLRVNLERIAEVIRRTKADIVGTQEILHSQAAAISKLTGLGFMFGEARKIKGERYGNAVFSIFPVVKNESYDLTIRKYEARQCLRVSIALSEAVKLEFYVVHLGTSLLERRQQAHRLLSKDVLQGPDINGVRIVVGDFNEWTRGLATRMLSQHLRSADIATHIKRRSTYPGVAPFLHLDHIYYDPQCELVGMHFERTRLALLASDHLPLIADFEV